MIFVKAVTGNVLLFLTLKCDVTVDHFLVFYVFVHFESCARQVRDNKVEGCSEGCLKVVFSDAVKSRCPNYINSMVCIVSRVPLLLIS